MGRRQACPNFLLAFEMAENQDKKCARCGGMFQCKAGSIEECDCTRLQLHQKTIELIQQQFNDCLCFDCLKQLPDTYKPGEKTGSGTI